MEATALSVRQIAEAWIGVVLVTGLVGVPNGTFAEERRVEHLVRAAAHWEQAGMAELASEVRQQLEAECPAARERLLERKQAELEQLQAEMAQLRQARVAGPQWAVQIRLFQVDWQRIEAMGLMLASLRDFDTPLPDGTGQLVALLESLKKQGLIRVLAEPVLQATPGRAATYEHGRDLSDGAVLGARSAFDHAWGTRVLCRPLHADDQRIKLDLEVRHAGLVPGPAKDSAAEESRRPVLLELRIETRIELVGGQPVLLSGLPMQPKSSPSWGLIAVLQATRAN